MFNIFISKFLHSALHSTEYAVPETAGKNSFLWVIYLRQENRVLFYALDHALLNPVLGMDGIIAAELQARAATIAIQEARTKG